MRKRIPQMAATTIDLTANHTIGGIIGITAGITKPANGTPETNLEPPIPTPPSDPTQTTGTITGITTEITKIIGDTTRLDRQIVRLNLVILDILTILVTSQRERIILIQTEGQVDLEIRSNVRIPRLIEINGITFQELLIIAFSVLSRRVFRPKQTEKNDRARIEWL